MADSAKFSAKNGAKVSNPLTLIAIFAGVTEAVGQLMLPHIDKLSATNQSVLVWFLVLFPVLLVILFFLTLNFNRNALYAPSDFDDEELFALLSGLDPESIKSHQYVSETEDHSTDTLKGYWKPAGELNEQHAATLRDWLATQGLQDTRLTVFIHSRETRYKDLRQLFIREHNLSASGH